MAREKKKKKQKEEEQEQQGELNPETEERKRLRKLAYSNSILSEAPANCFNPLTPSKTVVKHHGKDILKKSQRKNRYLFSFSGLLAPISGGKIGELTDLGSKNPVLYLDFPQGRMKLFGTIVYPKNRYLTLQFSRGGKNVMCEDCFDTVIVFCDACWVGRKEDNPDEARLDFPKEIFEGNHSEVDFQGGAGAGAMRNKDVKKVITKSTDEESLPESPPDDRETESSEGTQNTTDMKDITPVRHSERTAGKKFRFAEASSEDDSAETVSDMSGGENEEATKSSRRCLLDQDLRAPKTTAVIENSGGMQLLTRPNTEQAPLPALPNSETKESSHGSLVQATISTLFKKVEEKNTAGGSRKMAISKDSNKMQQSRIASKSKKPQAAELRTAQNSSEEKQAGKKNYRKKQKAEATEVEDDIEEFTSASEVGSDFEKKGSLLYEVMINDYDKYNSSLVSYIKD